MSVFEQRQQFVGVTFDFIDLPKPPPPAEIWLYLVLRRRVWRGEVGELAHWYTQGRLVTKISRQEMADRMGCSIRTIATMLAAMEERGWIKRIDDGQYEAKVIELGAMTPSVVNAGGWIEEFYIDGWVRQQHAESTGEVTPRQPAAHPPGNGLPTPQEASCLPPRQNFAYRNREGNREGNREELCGARDVLHSEQSRTRVQKPLALPIEGKAPPGVKIPTGDDDDGASERRARSKTKAKKRTGWGDLTKPPVDWEAGEVIEHFRQSFMAKFPGNVVPDHGGKEMKILKLRIGALRGSGQTKITMKEVVDAIFERWPFVKDQLRWTEDVPSYALLTTGSFFERVIRIAEGAGGFSEKHRYQPSEIKTTEAALEKVFGLKPDEDTEELDEEMKQLMTPKTVKSKHQKRMERVQAFNEEQKRLKENGDATDSR